MQKTQSLPLFLILMLWCFSLYPQSVTDTNPTAISPLVDIANGFSYTPFVDESSGTSESSAHVVYIPFILDPALGTSQDTFGIPNQFESYHYFGSTDGAKLTQFSGGAVLASTATTITFDLNINQELGAEFLNMAVRLGSSTQYRVVDSVSTPFSGDVTNAQIDFNLTRLCDSTDINCSNFSNASTSSSLSGYTFVYFFLAGSAMGDGDPIDPTSVTNGVFYKIKLSNNIKTSNFIILNRIYKGDEQLIADFTGFNMGTDVESLYAHIKQEGSAYCEESQTISDSSNTMSIGTVGLTKNSSELFIQNKTLQSGLLNLKNLKNDMCYKIRLFYCDKFGWCSLGSQQLQNTPESIEALLEKQACFFFTAGFGTEHWVVNFFQEFRDRVLQRFWPGRVFIRLYYAKAPQYAPYILARPWLQKMIRGTAYMAYGVIKLIEYSWPVLLFLLGLFVVRWGFKLKTINQE